VSDKFDVEIKLELSCGPSITPTTTSTIVIPYEAEKVINVGEELKKTYTFSTSKPDTCPADLL
jgi:hypothetical protein